MDGKTQWDINFTGIENPWLVVLIIFIALAALYYSWAGVKTLYPLTRRFLLLALRIFAIIFIMLVLFQPEIEKSETLKLKNKIVCLLDTSQSMSLKGGDTGISRFQLVKNFFRDNASFIEELQDNFDVDYFAFSDKITEVSMEDIEKGPVLDGSDTDFGQVFKLLKKRYDGKPVKGVFVFSDGVDTVELPATVDKLGIISNLAKDLSVPFFTFSPGGAMDIMDIAISNLSYNSFTFVRSPWKAEITLKIQGYSDLKLPITLKRGEDIISSQILDTGSEKEIRIDLSFTPYTTGTFLYTISVPVQPHEAITENNQVSFSVKVIRDKIRIMHVCGRPSWDEKFLRQLLKGDPNIDLVSFFILRTPTDISDVSSDELSLIPFPVDELFTQVLDSFDLVIFQNFDYRPYDTVFFRFSHYLNNLRNFVVEQGGGFLMIGGDISFSQGGYDGTAIEEILPFDLAAEKDTIDTSRHKALPTIDGLKHPVTAFDDDIDRVIAIWNDLPELDGCNVVNRVKPDAVVLAIYPTEGNPPLIAVRDAGLGRSMAIASDALWRWNFLSVGRGGSNRHYVMFWRNAIKWLIKDPTLNLIRIVTDKEAYLPEEDVHIRVEVLGRNYQPVEGVHLDIDITSESLKKSIFSGQGITGADGQYAFTIKLEGKGYYIVKAGARKGEDDMGQNYTIFHVAMENREFKDPSIRRDFLARLADITGGKYFDLPVKDVGNQITIDNPQIVRLAGKRQISLWDNWYIFLSILAIVSAEWWARKRKGLS